MSINKFIKLMVKKIWILILCVFVFALMGFVVAKCIMKPVYASQGLVYVASKDTISDSNDIVFSKSLVDSYMIIIDSDSFIDIIRQEVAEKDVSYTNEQIRKMIKTQKNQETFTIKVSNKNAEHAHIICASYLKNVQTEIPKIVGNIKQNAVVILNESKLATKPESPNVLLYTVIFFAVGGVIGVLIIWLLDRLDDRIKGEDDLQENFDIPLLGVIYDNLDNDLAEDSNENR